MPATKRPAPRPAKRRPGRPPAAAPAKPTAQSASISLTPEQRDRLYAAARAHGYRIEMGPRSQVKEFVDYLLSLIPASSH